MFDLPRPKDKWDKKLDWDRKLERKRNPGIKFANRGRMNRLKSTRILLGYTQAQLAKRVAIGLRTYGSYEQEQWYPKISTALKIAEFLDSSCKYPWGTSQYESRVKNDKHPKYRSERQELKTRQQMFKEINPCFDKKRLKKYRTFLGYSQAAFTEKIGVTLITYQSYEQEINEPNVRVAINIAYYLGTNCYSLFACKKPYDYSYRWKDK